VRLQFEFTNNATEYETCIIGLEAALELKVGKLDVYRANYLPSEGRMTNQRWEVEVLGLSLKVS
jgi:ribonuclease HI